MKPEYIDAVIALVGGEVSGWTKGPLDKLKFWDSQTPPTEEEIQNKLSELIFEYPMQVLRIERNFRLAETDWRATVDYPKTDKQLWLDYRQALRDLPATAEPQLDEQGNLTNVDWPEVPE